jgi:hypothetical protein
MNIMRPRRHRRSRARPGPPPPWLAPPIDWATAWERQIDEHRDGLIAEQLPEPALPVSITVQVRRPRRKLKT